MSAYRLIELPIQSDVLRGNPLGDPHERILRVLAPREEGDAPLPVVWILAAYGGTAAALVQEDPWSENLLDQINRLSEEGSLPPALFALPDCFTLLGGSQYLDSLATGRYETHLWEELRPLVEANFSCSGRHGVTGRSSGGYGAWIQGVRQRDYVKAIAVHAGDMAFDLCYRGAFPLLAEMIRGHGGIEPFYEAFRQTRNKRSGPWFGAIQTLAMAACYSPSRKAPLGIDLPFEPATLTMREDVWERWLALDPVEMVDEPAVQEALRGLDLLFLDCGSRDEYHLQWGLRQLAGKLDALGISHEVEEFDDGHRSTSYRYDVSLPKLVAALSP